MARHKFISNAEKTLPVVLIEQGINPTELYLDFEEDKSIDGKVNIARLARKYGKARTTMKGYFDLYEIESVNH